MLLCSASDPRYHNEVDNINMTTIGKSLKLFFIDHTRQRKCKTISGNHQRLSPPFFVALHPGKRLLQAHTIR